MKWKCLLLLLILPVLSIAQSAVLNPWTHVQNPAFNRENLRLQPTSYQTFQLRAGQLGTIDQRQQTVIALPTPDGDFQQFSIHETPVLAPRLQEKYPYIRTYTGYATANPRATVKLDITPAGLHALIYDGNSTYAIEPALASPSDQYLTFYKKHLPAPGFQCGLNRTDIFPPLSSARTTANLPTGTELRTYRLAIGATGEYTQFHGGTKAQALAAMVTTMNRVNGIYERDFTVTMLIVPGNDTLIYTDPATDPYTNTNLGAMLSENQNLCDSLIGSPNYDIGHVFGTFGGGLAGLGVVCTGGKAQGGTGLNAPIGDFWSVDYVSHEIGHQFRGNHTFNECGSQAQDGYEPGSGVTIMAYAGLCGSSNIANNSIDQFHVYTYEEVVNFTTVGAGSNCPVVTATGNQPPIVNVPSGGFYIPFQTPFELEASATDPDGDSLTYCWEQFDLGPQTPPNVPAGTAPLFRTFPASPDSMRICPKIDDIVNNTQTIGELLPQFGRPMNWRVLVRDNNPGAGGADYGTLSFTVADSAGPFEVTFPNGGQIWQAGNVETVTWDVANTDIAPVNCQAVDIYLSLDGGFTYPVQLAANRPNTGFASISVPAFSGNQMRVKVKAADNIFFDISNQDFEIQAGSAPDYSLTTQQPFATRCGMDSAFYSIDVLSFNGFNSPVNLSILNLPVGATAIFPASVTPPATVDVIVVSSTNLAPGDYNFEIFGNASTGSRFYPLILQQRDISAAAAVPVQPQDGATNQSIQPAFSWAAVPFASSYELQVSDDPTFGNLTYSANNIFNTNHSLIGQLQANTVYFWRVRSESAECDPGAWSSVFSFQTLITNCTQYFSADVPKNISATGTPTIISLLNVPNSGTISSISVIDLQGTHTYVSDLRVRLFSPTGSSIILFNSICGGNDDFNLNFSDTAATANIPCPPTTGLFYTPLNPLSTFNGLNQSGNWALEVSDLANADGGSLNNWGLEICEPPTIFNQPTVVTTPLLLPENSSSTILNTDLSGICNPGGGTITYLLTQLPQLGTLSLSGQTLNIGDTFTQSDIDNGLLTYSHSGPQIGLDQFVFSALCAPTGYIGGQVFSIEVITKVQAANQQVDLYLYPNPATQAVNVRLPPEFADQGRIRLVDMTGRVLQERSVETPAMVLSTGDLAQGVYSCQFWVNGRMRGERRLVIAGR